MQRQLFPQVPRQLFSLRFRRLSSRVTPQYSRMISSGPFPRLWVRLTFPLCFHQTLRFFCQESSPQGRSLSFLLIPRLLTRWPPWLSSVEVWCLSSRQDPPRVLFPSCVRPHPLIFFVTVFPTSYSYSFFFRVQIYN